MTQSEILARNIFAIFARRGRGADDSALRYRRRAAYLLLLCALIAVAPPAARAQGARKDDIAFGTNGRPLAGATITICTATATGNPCSPLAQIYTDGTLSVPTANPFQADGLGNYHFYAAPGRYVVQVSGSGINTYTIPDTLLPSDPSTPTFNSVTATSLALGGDLTVGGNATITGTLNAATFNPSSISTSSMSISGNLQSAGPRPRIDVTAPPYNAYGDGIHDDTSAIQAALNAACSTSSSGGGTVYFPPTKNNSGNATYYVVSQPQLPSTAPVFTVTCALSLEGGGSYGGTATQFSRPPLTRILVNAGSSPNLAPVFLFANSGSASAKSIRDLSIQGYNQAVQLYNTTSVQFDNVCLSVGNTGQTLGGTTDNTPLAIYATFWVWFRGGCLVNSGTSSVNTPVSVIAFVPGAGVQPNLGIVTFRDVIASGGGFIVDSRGNSSNGGGNLYFDGVQDENNADPFLTVSNSGGTAFPQWTAVEFRNAANYDCGPGTPFMSVSNVAVEGVYAWNTFSCTGNQAFVSLSGTASISQVLGLASGSLPQSSTGAPSGNAVLQTSEGWDFMAYNTTAQLDAMQQTGFQLYGCCGAGIFGGPNGAPIRMGLSGNSQAMLGIAPSTGMMFGNGAEIGYESSFARNTANSLDVSFAGALSPTGITATPTTGGSMAAGTYYYNMASYTTSSSIESAAAGEIPCVISGSNNACTISWTAPGGTHPGGCYIWRNTTSGGTYGSGPIATQITNCVSTTSYTDTGGNIGAGAAPAFNASIAPFYHFAPNASNPSGGSVPYFSGTPSGCATWGSSGLLSGTGSSCGGGSAQTAFAPSPNQAGNSAAPSSANAINVVAFYLPTTVQFSKLTVDVATSDTTSGSLCGSFADCYDVGLYNTSGTLQCDWGATALSSTGLKDIACAQGTVTLAQGYYIFAFTGNATTGKIYFGFTSGGGFALLNTATSGTSSASGALPSTISLPTFATSPNITGTYANVFIEMH
ncbi:MAG: glycosyl hydrolase family 28-related protein [Candidatus Acidiferrales bacterium]